MNVQGTHCGPSRTAAAFEASTRTQQSRGPGSPHSSHGPSPAASGSNARGGVVGSAYRAFPRASLAERYAGCVYTGPQRPAATSAALPGGPSAQAAPAGDARPREPRAPVADHVHARPLALQQRYAGSAYHGPRRAELQGGPPPAGAGVDDAPPPYTPRAEASHFSEEANAMAGSTAAPPDFESAVRDIASPPPYSVIDPLARR